MTTYFKVFRRVPGPALASIFWRPDQPEEYLEKGDFGGLLYIQDQTLRARAEAEGYTLADFFPSSGVFLPPLPWGPLAAFKSLDAARSFAERVAVPGDHVEIWEVFGLLSPHKALSDPFGQTLALEECPNETVFLNTCALKAKVWEIQK